MFVRFGALFLLGSVFHVEEFTGEKPALVGPLAIILVDRNFTFGEELHFRLAFLLIKYIKFAIFVRKNCVRNHK